MYRRNVVEEPEFIQKVISKLVHNYSNKNTTFTVKELNIEDLVPNVIDNYVITIENGRQMVYLTDDIVGLSFKNWKKGRGGIFSKDVLYHTLGKNTSRYMLLICESEQTIIRMIDEFEIDKFTSLKLIDGKLIDAPFMILKKITVDETLTTSNRINIMKEDTYFLEILEVGKEDEDEKGVKVENKSTKLF
jgi:hypothetical protein